MAMTRKFNATIIEYCASGSKGQEPVYRLLEWVEDGLCLCWELHRAEWTAYDDGDAESGPHLSCDLGLFQVLCGGMGKETVEDAVHRYEDQLKQEALNG